jgi:hypothetical protein
VSIRPFEIESVLKVHFDVWDMIGSLELGSSDGCAGGLLLFNVHRSDDGQFNIRWAERTWNYIECSPSCRFRIILPSTYTGGNDKTRHFGCSALYCQQVMIRSVRQTLVAEYKVNQSLPEHFFGLPESGTRNDICRELIEHVH